MCACTYSVSHRHAQLHVYLCEIEDIYFTSTLQGSAGLACCSTEIKWRRGSTMASPTAADGTDRAPVAPALAAYQRPAVEELCEYTERFTHYFVANDIVAVEKRRAIFLTAVGPTTYRLLKTLVSPNKLDEFRFEELVEKAMTHFNPKPSPIVKRYEFNSRAKK